MLFSIRKAWLRLVAFLAWRHLCPCCLEIRSRVRTCPYCRVACCVENCYGELAGPGERCAACEYPD